MEWISVKEKKPPYGWMLIAYKYHLDPSILRSDLGLYFDDVFTSAGVVREVTHWMRIPEPPKEQQ